MFAMQILVVDKCNREYLHSNFKISLTAAVNGTNYKCSTMGDRVQLLEYYK